MSTSRRLSNNSKANRNSHTPGKTKGGNCVRPKDFGVAINGNPYKGAGMKGAIGNTYTRLWDKYKTAKGNS